MNEKYSSNWVEESGLNLDPGYCITAVRGIGPRDSLHRFGIHDSSLLTSLWSELAARAREVSEPAYDAVPIAAFAIEDFTVIVEENGYRGSIDELLESLSRGTAAVNVYLSPSSGGQELKIFEDGRQIAYIDGDSPDEIDTLDSELRIRLNQLIDITSGPLDSESDPQEVPEDEGDAEWADLLQVACEYLGLQPQISHVSGPVLGAVDSLQATYGIVK
ncbi:DUF6461 domain-containing protein [Streptomyces sp. NPDC088354]|uniref:DUF6461 domain-containing protein n=1 Tax=Streptomyces sp. NPDC088354 TaxID=3365856 RepID=UPI00381F815A